MDIFEIFWIGWLASFGGMEAWAIVRKEKGDTLSEHVWKWLQLREESGRKTRLLGRVGMVGLLFWLMLHFITGGEV